MVAIVNTTRKEINAESASRCTMQWSGLEEKTLPRQTSVKHATQKAVAVPAMRLPTRASLTSLTMSRFASIVKIIPAATVVRRVCRFTRLEQITHTMLEKAASLAAAIPQELWQTPRATLTLGGARARTL